MNFPRFSENEWNSLISEVFPNISAPFSPDTVGRRRRSHLFCPPLGEFFCVKLIKINDFTVKIINFKGFQSVLLSNFVIKYCYFHENSFFDQNLIKKNFIRKIIFWWKKIFFDEIFTWKIDFFKPKMWNSNSEGASEFKNEVFIRFYCQDQKFVILKCSFFRFTWSIHGPNDIRKYWNH